MQPDEKERKLRRAAESLPDEGRANVLEITVRDRVNAAIKSGDAPAIFSMMPDFAALDSAEWKGIAALIVSGFKKVIIRKDLDDEYRKACFKSARRFDNGVRDWRDELIAPKGTPLALVSNALTAIRGAEEWQGVLAFNESSLRAIVRSAPPWEESRPLPFVWSDEDDIRTADWLQKHQIMVSSRVAGEAVQAAAHDNSFHPIRDYINGLEWDGVKRIDNWLTLYLGVDPSDYARAVGAKWLTAAVARVLSPGCKFDYCLILEGAQGVYKSTSLKTLGGEWHSDDMPELGTKDAALQTKGTWIIELAELDSMARSDVNRIKAFMSRATDRFRPPFGKNVIESPRECIFAGTVNHSNYLKDETGGRRFWPVACGVISIKELKRDRDQLWAEARERYLSGATLWLEDIALIKAAIAEQRKRYEGDPWDDLIANWVDGREEVTVGEVLGYCIDKPKAQWSHVDRSRVARALVSLGWRIHQADGGDGRKRIYRPPVEMSLFT